MLGFFAGPTVHIVDEHALSDPLLARMPGGDATSIMGHLARRVPEGYLETIASGRNQIVDPDLARYYEPLHEVVAGPLWSRHRVETLARFLAGQYDHHLAAYLARARR
jgi:arabinofuranosyltransferase